MPGKLLRNWKGKTLLQHTYDVCLKTGFETWVISDDKEITLDQIKWHALQSPPAENGTDRCSKYMLDSVVRIRELYNNYSIIINVQADEVEINPDHIIQLADFAERKGLPVSTLCSTWGERDSDGDVKVCYSPICQKALWFDRPPFRENSRSIEISKHIGVYAYSLFFLEQYPSLKKGYYESALSLEQFRVLENGMQIGCLEVDSPDSIAVNTEEDYQALLEKA